MLPDVSILKMSDAYESGAEAWKQGPDTVYRRFAQVLVDAVPLPLARTYILDVGAGTGAVSAALARSGARVVATDRSPEMLRHARRAVPGLEVVVADALHQPFGDGTFDGALSGFCINHVPEPHRLLAECSRVVQPGGFVLASTFAGGEDHPAKACIEVVARRWGWERPDWDDDFRNWSTLTDSAEQLTATAEGSGLEEITVCTEIVDTGISTAAELVQWRLGMAQFAGWVRSLSADERTQFVMTAEAALGVRPQPLRRAVLILSSRAPA